MNSSCAMVALVMLLKEVYLDNQQYDRRDISGLRSISLALLQNGHKYKILSRKIALLNDLSTYFLNSPRR